MEKWRKKGMEEKEEMQVKEEIEGEKSCYQAG